MVDVSEAPAEAGSAGGDAMAMDVDTSDIPMLDVCVCDRFVSLVSERFLVESIGFDASSKSSSGWSSFVASKCVCGNQIGL